MKLSISNIAWDAKSDEMAYGLMKKHGFSGLEIAPTRIFSDAPYDKINEATLWSGRLFEEYGFRIPSMQSIWYGRQEKIFGSSEERQILLDYTKKAIDFASAIGCKNLVFGCPNNRRLPECVEEELAISFFRELGDYAAQKETVIGMEANPPIYNTNFINDTTSAFDLIEQVDSEGFKLNLDVGTIIQNEEAISKLIGKVRLINHVHISEPRLKPIEVRSLHNELRSILMNESYHGYVSIEMEKTLDISIIEEKMEYVRAIFN